MAPYPTWQFLLESVKAAREERGNTKAMNSVASKYKLFSKNNNIIAYPASALSVSSYLCSHVVRLNGSTKSIGNIISAIKKYGILRGYAWLDETELSKLMEVRKELQFIDTSTTNLKKAMTLDKVVKIIHTLNLNHHEELLIAMLMLLCHNGLLRSGELFSGIKVEDITLNFKDNCITLSLNRSKIC